MILILTMTCQATKYNTTRRSRSSWSPHDFLSKSLFRQNIEELSEYCYVYLYWARTTCWFSPGTSSMKVRTGQPQMASGRLPGATPHGLLHFAVNHRVLTWRAGSIPGAKYRPLRARRSSTRWAGRSSASSGPVSTVRNAFVDAVRRRFVARLFWLAVPAALFARFPCLLLDRRQRHTVTSTVRSGTQR